MITAPDTLTALQAAVIATRPVSAPLRIRLRSGFASSGHATIVPETQAAAPAMAVFSAIRAIASASAAMVLPALNPNHPSQRMKAPSVAAVMLCAGTGTASPLGRYLPSRGPSTITPLNAAQPPTLCTTVAPAKSTNPRRASQPPRTQCPSDRVDAGDQDEREQQKRAELDPFRHGAADDRRRGTREHQLKEELRRRAARRRRTTRCRRPRYAAPGQRTVIGAVQEPSRESDGRVAIAEGQPESRQPEGERRHGEHDEVLRQDD